MTMHTYNIKRGTSLHKSYPRGNELFLVSCRKQWKRARTGFSVGRCMLHVTAEV